MPKNDFWDLTYRPYTRLKLNIFKEYIYFWARIFFSKASKNKTWESWQDLYFID